MEKFKYILGIIVLLGLAGCVKEDPTTPTSNLPSGATPYTEADIQFVPYTSTNKVFKKLPALDSTWVLNFKERLRTEEYFAWDQTFMAFDFDPSYEVELRLRYLQTDVSQKTLAVYMPYKDNSGTPRTTLFEMPLSPTTIETSFFENIIDYHDTIVFNSISWYKVYEVNQLISTDPAKDGPQNFKKIYYNKVYGIIKMDQNNGDSWLLQQ